jgi:cellulose biosynthesis protein BcsQ
MDVSGLYELIERLYRTDHFPAFLTGMVVSLLFGLLAMRLLRLRLVGSGVNSELGRLERKNEALASEGDHLRRELQHAQKDAEADRFRIGELSGQLKSQVDNGTDLTSECERLKEELTAIDSERQQLIERNLRARRLVVKLTKKLEGAELSDGRIWESDAPTNAVKFRPLNLRRTPIMSLLNLKGGVGKTTIAANLAVAMAQLGWRVLTVDLDYQGSLSQLMLANADFEDLLASRRLIDDALSDAGDGLARFRKAITRVSRLPDAEIFVVAADEELGIIEEALSKRWLVKSTPDDVRYRLRAILHSEEIAERFDFILLDCPPRLTTACVNALGASDYVLIPVLPNATSTWSVPRLLNWLKHLRGVVCPELSVMGVVGNKAKYYGAAPVKKQQEELNTVAGFCQDTWGSPIRFFPPLRMHDPLVQPLPALDPKLGEAYRDLVHQINEDLPNYARCRSRKLSPSLDSSIGSIGR